MKKKIIIFLIILTIVPIISFWIIVSGGYDKQNKTILFLKEVIPSPLARKIRDTIFFIPKLQDRNKFLEIQLTKFEQGLEGNIFFDGTAKSKQNEYSFKKFFLPFPSLDQSLGWNAKKNSLRAHYLEIVDDNIFVISGEGKTIFFDKKNIFKKKLNQKEIKNNLKSNIESKGNFLGAIRDMYYENNFIYLSVVELIDNKSTLNIYRAEKNLKFLNFKIFFETKEYNDDGNVLQSGGRIEKFNSEEILLSIGFFGKYDKAQDESSIVGKIISINKENRNFTLKSKGHRNPQGLFYWKEKNIIINSEHGPKGGDEINFNTISDVSIKDFGWPKSSYGEPYGKFAGSIFEERGYLKKSHSDYGFVEPIKYFTPSIAISEIFLNENKIYASSLRAESIYILKILENSKVEMIERVNLKNRIRDLKYDNENDLFFVILENTPSFGVVKFN